MKSTVNKFFMAMVIVISIAVNGQSQTTFPDTARSPGKIIMDDKIDTARQIRDSVYTPKLIKSNTPDNRGKREDDSLRRLNQKRNEMKDSIPKHK